MQENKSNIIVYNDGELELKFRLKMKLFKNSHDRFLIIDKKEVYHIGASLKDLGKKWFAFSKFEIQSLEILERLKYRW